MGSCHGQLEVIHSTGYLLIISLRDFFFFSSGAGTGSGAKVRVEEHSRVYSQGYPDSRLIWECHHSNSLGACC